MSLRDRIRMTDEEIRDFLRTSRTMTIVSNGKSGYPHAMPMWFAVDDNNIVHMTTYGKSQKVNNIMRDPRVTLLVESGDRYEELKGVMIYAHAEVIDDADAKVDAMFKVSVARGDMQAGQKAAAREQLAKATEKRVALRFTPEKIVSWDHSKLTGSHTRLYE